MVPLCQAVPFKVRLYLIELLCCNVYIQRARQDLNLRPAEPESVMPAKLNKRKGYKCLKLKFLLR